MIYDFTRLVSDEGEVRLILCDDYLDNKEQILQTSTDDLTRAYSDNMKDVDAFHV